MSTTVSYGIFQTPDNTLTKDGGAWVIQQSAKEISCHSARNSACAAQGCLTCTIFNNAASPSYTLKYMVNVSIPISQYGNANNLDYSFSYHFLWTSNEVAAGVSLSTKLAVGSSSNTDSFVSSDHTALWNSVVPDLGDPFFHSGTTSLLKSVDGSTAYIPIAVDFSFSKEPGLVEWYLIARKFSVSAPSPGNTLSASGSSSSTQVQASSISPSVIITDTVTPSSVPIQSTPSSTLISQTPASNDSVITVPSTLSNPYSKIPVNEIIGGVIGGIFSLGIVLAVLILLHSWRQRVSWGRNRGESTHHITTFPGGDPVSIPSTALPVRKPHLVFPNTSATSSSSEVKSTAAFSPLKTFPIRTATATTSVSPVLSSLVASRLPSGSRQREIVDYQRLRRDIWQQEQLFSPPTETDVPPPAYSIITNTSGAANERTEARSEATEEFPDAMSAVVTSTQVDISTVQSGSVRVEGVAAGGIRVQ
ncbi:hypothetical protein FRC20_001508 [Serendipita sp. 405]|nr:hypothetical protein FRC20_001508 [Serendipita sp. 405]